MNKPTVSTLTPPPDDGTLIDPVATEDDEGALEPDRAQLCRGVWLPEGERHFVEMIEHKSKIGDRGGRGTYQVHKLDAAMAMLSAERCRVAVDIGAHVGLWSMWLVDIFDHVHAFEPVDDFARLFPFNVRGDNWTMHNCALGAAEGSVSLEIRETDTGCTHINGAGDIPLRSLDSFELDQVDFIKIDVEGYELAVCEGARDTLERCRPMVVVEQKGNDAKNFAAPRDGAAAYLLNLGMQRREVISGDWILDW